VAKRVRSETAIARGAANVSSVAVELAGRVFGELEKKTVLVVGAGKMSALAARHLAGEGAAPILVTNRSPQRAETLAADIGGEARPWAKLTELFVEADVVVSSTGAQEPIATRATMKQVMKARKHRPIFIVDIAVPRDFEPDAAKIDGVYLFDIDDLERVVADNRRGREGESSSAELIVEHETRQFLSWQRAQGAVPTIKALRERSLAIATAEAKKFASAAGPGNEEAMVRLAQSIVNKLLHKPLTAMKADDELAEAAQRLFDLGEEKDA
jgi:glutamyl-tRNA reductase